MTRVRCLGYFTQQNHLEHEKLGLFLRKHVEGSTGNYQSMFWLKSLMIPLLTYCLNSYYFPDTMQVPGV